MRARWVKIMTLCLCVVMTGTTVSAAELGDNQSVYESTATEATEVTESVEAAEMTEAVEAATQQEVVTQIEDTIKMADGVYTLEVSSGSNITQSLIAALKTYQSVVIPAGNYTCGKVNISDFSGLTITATGAVITAEGSDPILMTATDSSVNGVTVTGGEWKSVKEAPIFRFYGSTKNLTLDSVILSDGGDAGARIANADTVTVKNITVKNNADYGLNLESVQNVTISNSSFEENKNCGIRLKSVSNVSITDTKIQNNVKSGVLVDTGSAVTLSNLTVSGNKEYGVNVSSSNGTVISGGTVLNNENSGLLINEANGTTVTGTDVSENGKYGIYCQNSKATFNNVISKKNYWSGVSISGKKANVTVNGGVYNENGTRPDAFEGDDSTCAGIGVYSGASLNASEVTMNQNHGCGLAVAGSKKNICKAVIAGCTLDNNNDHGIGARPYAKITVSMSASGVKTSTSQNKNHGILLNDNCSADRIADVESNGNGKAGISIGKSSVVTSISNSVFTSNGDDGIHLADKSEATITKCTVSENSKAGIGLYTTSKARLNKGNTAYKNGTYGLVVDASTVSAIQAGSFTENKDSGILIRNKSTVKKIQNTVSSQNGSYGLYVAKASSAKVTNSKFEQNKKDGIRTTDSGSSVEITKCTASSNKQNGIIITNKAKLKTLTGSTIQKNKKHGLVMQNKATSGTYKGNKISKNKKYQVYVSGCKTSIKKKK